MVHTVVHWTNNNADNIRLGHLQFNTQFGSLTESQIESQVLHLLKTSPIPSLITVSFVELMYGVALSLCWILVFKMDTQFLSGTKGPGELNLWSILPTICHWLQWFVIFKPIMSVLNFI